MRRAVLSRASLVLVGTLLGLAGAGTALAGDSYTATLSPDEETPAKGPAGSSGAAALRFDHASAKACSTITFTGIDQPTAAHVHQGAKGATGDPVISLGAPKNGEESCVPVPAEVASAIAADPAGHYVNVHTEKYRGGAMRGQLSRSGY